MIHPNVFGRGKVLQKEESEIGLQIFPGGTVALGAGDGLDVRFSAGLEGDDIWGGELLISKGLVAKKQYYASASIGYDFFWNLAHLYEGRRISVGYAVSWYTKSGKAGLHLPLRGYYMSYDWDLGWDERNTQAITDVSGSGFVFVPGVGFSWEGPSAALRLGLNAPTRSEIDHVELLPCFGVQLAFKM